MGRRSATACGNACRNLAENEFSVRVAVFFAPKRHLGYPLSMPLPETITVRFTEEDAGYVTVRPVVKQTFRLSELTDMVVSVTGKDVSRVKQIFRAGTVVYNGYKYWWSGFDSDASDLAAVLAAFPDDDPSRPFDPLAATNISLETGGGTQRSRIGVSRQEASAKRLFHKQSPWEILLKAARESTPRYEKYSHSHRADIYCLHLSAKMGVALLKEMFDAAPRSLRKKLAGLQPPSALLFFAPRAHS
jgi:hypothetical protein